MLASSRVRPVLLLWGPYLVCVQLRQKLGQKPVSKDLQVILRYGQERTITLGFLLGIFLLERAY